MSAPPESVLEGLRLLDRRRFHAAHAAFERAWRAAVGPERRLWQALVQVAAACHHAERNRLRPAVTLLGRARRHLAGLPDLAAGVDLIRLRRQADRIERRLREAQAAGAGWRPDRASRFEILLPPKAL